MSQGFTQPYPYPLRLGLGGSGASLTASNGGIVYSTASAFAILAGVPSLNLPLLSSVSSAPVWGAYAITLGGAITTAGYLTMVGAFGVTQTYTGTTNITMPQAGTVAVLTDIPSFSPAALTTADDTNVTITLGGSPGTALLQATSLTLGWTGQLGLARGGTAASLTASDGGIVYSTASAFAILAAGSVGQIPRSGGAGAPTWSTATYPDTAGTSGNVLTSNGTNWTSAVPAAGGAYNYGLTYIMARGIY